MEKTVDLRKIGKVLEKGIKHVGAIGGAIDAIGAIGDAIEKPTAGNVTKAVLNR